MKYLVEIYSRRSRWQMWGLSLDTWNSVLLGLLWFGAFVAACVALVTYVTINLANEEAAKSKAALEAYKLSVEAKVADAKSEGIKAGETAMNAQLRAAELEKETALAKLQTEQIKQIVAWRTLPAELADRLTQLLRVNPGRVNLRYTDGDPESLFLAIQLSKILTEANWQVAGGTTKSNSIFFGIGLPDPVSEDMDHLRKAFLEVGIPFTTETVPNSQSSVSFNISTLTGAPTLLIGSRPPPELK